MKIYKVKVNDKIYEVELQSVEKRESDISVPVTEKKTADTQPSSGDNTICAPIAGKILDIKVSIGDRVNSGDTVAIIEAMKLENEIQSAFSGAVKEILVSKGDDVRNKDALIILK